MKARKTKAHKLCAMQCGRKAVDKGYCRSCLNRLFGRKVKRTRIVTTCIQCSGPIREFKGQRYCRNHARLRGP